MSANSYTGTILNKMNNVINLIMKSRIKTIVLFLLIGISTSAVGQNNNEDKAAIQQVVDRFKAAIVSEDKEAFMTLFVKEEVSWVGCGSRGAMFASPESFMSLVAQLGNCREDFHNVNIWHDEYIGVVSFDYGFFENDTLMNWGKESWMLIKRNDQWKITSVNFSINMPFAKPYPFGEEKN